METTIPMTAPAPLEAADYSLNLKKRRGVGLLTDLVIFAGVLGDSIAGLIAVMVGLLAPLDPHLIGSTLSPGVVPIQVFVRCALFGAIILLCAFFHFEVYARGIMLDLHEICSRVIRGCALWLVLVLAAALFLSAAIPVPPARVALTALFVLVTTLSWRWLLHLVLAVTGFENKLRQQVLFLGWTPESGRMARLIWQQQTVPCEVVGYVDLPPGATQHTPPGNVPYLGSYEDLTEVLQREFVNVVILTDVNIPRNAIVEVAATCEKELVDFKIIPSYFPILVSAMQVEHLSGIPVLGVDKLPLNSLANRLVKRAMDILGALAGLAIAAPFILVFGILIYLESPGSIFFRQERIGRRGLRFDMFKLRSMRPDAAAQDHLAQSTVRGDPRLLRVGAFMRRWNIDELPQFWNVLVGDMSLVGPRPERTYHSEILKNQIPHYNARYISKPGLTGWAQIHGLRGDTDLTERIQHDIYYMEHWTVLLDIQIAFRTIFSFKNAC